MFSNIKLSREMYYKGVSNKNRNPSVFDKLIEFDFQVRSYVSVYLTFSIDKDAM